LWSSVNRWVERCRAWDAHCDQVRQQAILARHVRHGRLSMDKGLEAILARKPEEITIDQAINLMMNGAKLARVGANLAEPDAKASAAALAAARQENVLNVHLGTDALLEAARRLNAEQQTRQAKVIEATPHAEPNATAAEPPEPSPAP
jgi:hypothetical protein